MQKKIPALSINMEGLRRTAKMHSIFIADDVEPSERRWRTWLVEVSTKATRHYEAARRLADGAAPAVNIKGKNLQPMPMFDYSFEMEDCITSTYKAIKAICALKVSQQFPEAHAPTLEQEISLITKFRNKQEHLHEMLPRSQAARGPILIAVNSERDSIQLSDCSLSFEALIALLNAIYRDIATLYPGHDVNSPPEEQTMTGLTISVQIETTAADGTVSLTNI